MFGEATIFHVMIWNHPIETTITNWLFGVPGWNVLSAESLRKMSVNSDYLQHDLRCWGGQNKAKLFFWYLTGMPLSSSSKPKSNSWSHSTCKFGGSETTVKKKKTHGVTKLHGCFLQWWYPQNTPKWWCLGKPIVVGYHHFRKPP